MSQRDRLARIARVEFAAIVTQTDPLGAKLRIHLIDESYIDVYVSRKLTHRFGFHWERGHIDGTIYRYDSFPDTNWSTVATFPYHFHDGAQENVVAAPFPTEPEPAFRAFLRFARDKLAD